MKQQKRVSLRLLAAALAVCLLLPLVGCGGREPEPATEVARLSKLCRVWGYVKYTHPAFLLGQKDWDEELLTLIPQVRELETEQEVNALLHKWFMGLGEIDYGTNKPVRFWAEAAEKDRLVITDTSWTTDAEYLGTDLAGDLGQLGEIPDITLRKGPVKYQRDSLTEVTYPIFTREKDYPDMDFSDPGYRLLGLFRAWNILEYYFPYHDLLDRAWEEEMDELIPVMLAGEDQNSYLQTIYALLAHLHDNHAGIMSQRYDYTLALDLPVWDIPVYVTEAEGKLVVSDVTEDCPLARGDIILEMNGMSVEEAVQILKPYTSCSRDSVFLSQHTDEILHEMSSIQDPATVTVLREGEEETFSFSWPWSITSGSPREAYLILEGNIGLINPESFRSTLFRNMMEDLRSTNGLIIDLRQYPPVGMLGISSYFTSEYNPIFIHSSPSKAVPGAYVREVHSDGYRPEDAELGAYYYDKPVVVLIDEFSQSASEWAAWSIGKGENVVLMGQNTSGAMDRIGNAPLPGGDWFMFTAIRAELDDGSQVQRVGITPDIPVSRTIQGIKEGRDELMEAAMDYINRQKG